MAILIKYRLKILKTLKWGDRFDYVENFNYNLIYLIKEVNLTNFIKHNKNINPTR